MDRRVRATDRLTRAGAEHKRRIKDLCRQLLPMSPLTGELGVADLAVLERYADPNALVRLGPKRLTGLIGKASHGHLGADRARQWIEAADASLALYAGHPAVAFADLAAEVATEVRLLRAVHAELAGHAAERETRYSQVDPAGLARSLPGVADISGPALVAVIGDPARFRNGKAFRSFTGLVPKASETGDTDRKGQPMSKAGPSLLRTPDPRRRQRPPPRPAAGPDLLPPDDRTRQGPPRRPVCRRRKPGRTILDGDEPRPALHDLRHRRHPRRPRPGTRHHRQSLDRARRYPSPPPQQEREGPPDSPHRTAQATRTTRGHTRRPSPTSMVKDRRRKSQPKRLTNPIPIGNQHGAWRDPG